VPARRRATRWYIGDVLVGTSRRRAPDGERASIPSLMDVQVAYLLLVTLSVLMLTSLTAYTWRFRADPMARRFGAFAASGAAWAMMVAVMAVSSPDRAPFWLNLKYAFIGLAPVAVLHFALELCGVAVSRRVSLALLVVPAVSQAVVWTNPAHHLMLRTIRFEQVGALTYPADITFGPFYWVFTGYCYALILGSAVLLWSARYRASSLLRDRNLLVVAGSLFPLATNALLITRVAPPQFDPMPLGMAISAGLLWWGALRHRMLDLVPLARNVLVDSLGDAMLAIDVQGRVIDANPEMLRLLGQQSRDVLGQSVDQATGLRAPLRELLRATLSASSAPDAPGTHPLTMAERHYDVRVFPLFDQRGARRGDVAVVQDVSERRTAEHDRERLIGELRRALETVRTLEGLLPICAHCKNIRTEQEVWEPIEQYIGERTAAAFTHSICPDCEQRHFPELATT
jgi:HTH-type transcriptional regulator, bacterioopsin transcriptional activator and related proteins